MQELFSIALDHIKNGVVITDPSQEDNPIVYVNPAFESITGYDAEEVMGKNCRFLQGEARNQIGLLKLRKAIKRKKSINVVLKNYKKNGQRFYNELYITPIEHQGKEYFIGIQNDVTQRVVAEKKLEKYSKDLEAQVESRTKKLLDTNRKLLDEIEQRKQTQERVIRLNRQLQLKTDRLKSKLDGPSPSYMRTIRLLINNPSKTLDELSKLSGRSPSTLSVARKNLLQKGLIHQLMLPNPYLFGMLTVVTAQSIPAIPNVFFSVQAEHQLALFFSKDYAEAQRTLGKIKDVREVFHFQMDASTMVRYFDFGEPMDIPSPYKLQENDYRVLYGAIKYPGRTKEYIAKRVELSYPTVLDKYNTMVQEGILLPKYIKDMKKSGKYITLSHERKDRCFFGIESHRNLYIHLTDESDLDTVDILSDFEANLDFAPVTKQFLTV